MLSFSTVEAGAVPLDDIINTCLTSPEKVGTEKYKVLKSCENVYQKECVEKQAIITTSEAERTKLCARLNQNTQTQTQTQERTKTEEEEEEQQQQNQKQEQEQEQTKEEEQKNESQLTAEPQPERKSFFQKIINFFRSLFKRN